MLDIPKRKAISINGKIEETSTVRVQRMRAGGKSAYDEMLKAQLTVMLQLFYLNKMKKGRSDSELKKQGHHLLCNTPL